jgi:hypothetical protein
MARILALVAVLAAAVVLIWPGAPPHPSHPPRLSPAASRPEAASLRAVRVLERWQEARSRAYADADVGALRRLHVTGSPAGRRDVAVLRAYAARGVALHLTTRSSRVAVLVSRPRLVVVRVRSLVQAEARHHGEERVLPSQGWAWRRLELRLVDGAWRLSSATPGSPRGQP